jgi:hypothetical protein
MGCMGCIERDWVDLFCRAPVVCSPHVCHESKQLAAISISSRVATSCHDMNAMAVLGLDVVRSWRVVHQELHTFPMALLQSHAIPSTVAQLPCCAKKCAGVHACKYQPS